MEPAVHNQLFRRSADAIFAEVGDDVVALHVPKGRCHGMEEVAAEVWRIIERPSSLDDICGKLLESYEVEPEECRADVADLLQSMLAEGLVTAD